MTDKYIHKVYPTAWCSICGPGKCEHNRHLNDGLLKSFKQTLFESFKQTKKEREHD